MLRKKWFDRGELKRPFGAVILPEMMVSAPKPTPEVVAELAFTKPEHVVDVGGGPRRAQTLEIAAMADRRSYDQQTCTIRDCTANPRFYPSLQIHGFSHADLSQRTKLQARFERVRRAGRLDPADIQAIRKHLTGTRIRLSDGTTLLLLLIAAEGFIMRSAGPNRIPIMREDSTMGSNGHDAAMAVHADQDVEGTPVRQILRRSAPFLFHHQSPYRQNRVSPLHLVNLWVPLDQVTRPLAIMDASTLNRRTHQLRYGLPTTHFLQRREDMRVNDIWTFLHAPDQQWYFTSGMDARRAYVFETLSTPHGAIVLPGEARAADRYRRLGDALAAVDARDLTSLRRVLARDDEPTAAPVTPALCQAIAAMDSIIVDTQKYAERLCAGHRVPTWRPRVEDAMRRVVRKSLEMRVVALRLPAFRFRKRSEEASCPTRV